MEKILITGVGGFVAKHFLALLEAKGLKIHVMGLDVLNSTTEPQFEHIDYQYRCVDLLDKGEIENILFLFNPDYILHLASYSSVAFSWKNPILSFQNNVNIFLNLVEVIRKYSLKTRILSIGSSEEYGNINAADVPLKETARLDPLSPYAIARVSQEMLSKLYSKSYGLDIVMTRSFNHIGPGQSDIFVVSSFVKRILEEKIQGHNTVNLSVGNVEIIRDFLDVRDVVLAYYELLHYGKNGEVYNVCSGNGWKLSDLIDLIAKLLGVKVITTVDESLLRPNDNKLIIGDNSKIKADTSWSPTISMQDSLVDIIQYWRNQL